MVAEVFEFKKTEINSFVHHLFCDTDYLKDLPLWCYHQCYQELQVHFS